MPEIRLQVRRDTAANWTTNNPVIRAGEIGYETDTRWHKIGDGTTAWNDLGYYHGPPWLTKIDGGSPGSTFAGEPSISFNGVMTTPALFTTLTTETQASTNFDEPPADIAGDGNGNWMLLTAQSTWSVYTSIDDGATWVQLTTLPSLLTTPQTIATDGNGVWVIMSNGSNAIIRSDDFGQTWTTEYNTTTRNVNGVTWIWWSEIASKFITNGSNQLIYSSDGTAPYTGVNNGNVFIPAGYLESDSLLHIYGDSGSNNPRNGDSTTALTWAMDNDFPTTLPDNGRPNNAADTDGSVFLVGAGTTDDWRYWYSTTFAAPWSIYRYNSTKTDGIIDIWYNLYLDRWYILTEIGELFYSSDPVADDGAWTQETGAYAGVTSIKNIWGYDDGHGGPTRILIDQNSALKINRTT